MCVFNFFFWKSWLAGEELYLLQKKRYFALNRRAQQVITHRCRLGCDYRKESTPQQRRGTAREQSASGGGVVALA